MMKNMIRRLSPAPLTASIGLGRDSRSIWFAPECCGGCGRNTQRQRSRWAYRVRGLSLNMCAT
eukprot:4217092-Lingulodinium_polyedra.AAC.1